MSKEVLERNRNYRYIDRECRRVNLLSIVNMFAEKYETLYNSVLSEPEIKRQVIININEKVKSDCMENKCQYYFKCLTADAIYSFIENL